jgi:hypothetical protein
MAEEASNSPAGQSAEHADPLLKVLRQAVLPLFLLDPKVGWHWIGSSFVVGYEERRAFLFTAGHNLRHVNRLALPPRLQHATLVPGLVAEPLPPLNRLTPRLYAGVPWQTGYQPAQIVESWFSVELDFGVAVAELLPEADVTFHGRLSIDASPIQVGTRVMAVGYPRLDVEMVAEDSATDAPRYLATTLLEYRLGTVTDICRAGTTISPWPGFLVNCSFDSGMSGGPILEVGDGNVKGRPITVRGIIGADMTEAPDTPNRGSGQRAFASMLWPALATKTRVGIEGLEGLVTVLDLVRHGVIDERGGALERLQVVEQDGLFHVRWRQ